MPLVKTVADYGFKLTNLTEVNYPFLEEIAANSF